MDESDAFGTTELTEELVALVKPELVPGERLIWATRSRAVHSTSWAWAYAATLWLVGSLMISVLSLAAFNGFFGTRILKVEGLLAVVGILSGTVSIVSLMSAISNVGSALSEWKLDRVPTYALTDRRVILWRTNVETKGIEIHSYPKGSIKNLSRVEYRDGTGDVNFSLAQPHPGATPTTMAGIPDVRQVEHYIRRMLIAELDERSRDVELRP